MVSIKNENLQNLNKKIVLVRTVTSAFLFLFVLSDSDRDELRLLCTDGTQAPLSHYRNCNLGRGPGGGMVTRFNFRKVARKFLVTMQVLFLVWLPSFPTFTYKFHNLCFYTTCLKRHFYPSKRF